MQSESTINDILIKYNHFRILCVGRAGAGKSSLINNVFKVNDAKVSHSEPGEADIFHEISSEQNPRFVLHDSKGYEPADTTTFNTVRDFIHKRGDINQALKHRLHAVWLCIETPTAGARVLEAGDELLLQLAYEKRIPVVTVFTKYDQLVETKELELTEDGVVDDLRKASEQAAKTVLDTCVASVARAMDRLKILVPSALSVSVEPGYERSVASLIKHTSDVLPGDAWLMWATAQRANLPLKIDACVKTGMTRYWSSLVGTVPGFGKMLLNECLGFVHQDIVTCWNFSDEGKVLNQNEFKQLILYVAQNVQDKDRNANSWPDIQKISNFVSLVKTATEVIVPPVAILGLAFFCVQCLSKHVRDKLPDVRSLMIAYSIDLILIMGELFDITLRPELSGSITWDAAFDAFEVYQGSGNRTRDLHDEINALVDRRQDVEALRAGVARLVQKYRKAA